MNTPSGKTITLTVRLSDTIKEVKEKIEEQEGIPPGKQKLKLACLAGVLKDDRTLNSYYIQREDTLRLVLRLGDVIVRLCVCVCI